MGSGSSKEKNSTPHHEIKKSESVPAKTKSVSIPTSNVRSSEPLKSSDQGTKQQNGNTTKLDLNENNNKTKGRIPQPFEDSDDEGDDLLSDQFSNRNNNKTGQKNGGIDSNSNNRLKTWQPPQPPKDDYPETYAQKMQREQYKSEKLLRQKTIYRDPKEWEVDKLNTTQTDTVSNFYTNEIEITSKVSQKSFDVSKFKEANKTIPKTDIFGPLSNNDYSYQNHEDDGMDYTPNHYGRKKSVPKYDVTEEELMADIESNYY